MEASEVIEYLVGGMRKGSAMDTRIGAMRRGLRIEFLSLGWMGIEAAVGIGAGIAAHALALQAFGVDSVIELVSGGILIWRLRVEVNGAVPERVAAAERRANGMVGWLLVALSAYIMVMAGLALVGHNGGGPTDLGLGLAVAAAVVMPILARSKRIIGEQIGSAALVADGSCNMVCAYLAWAVLVGLLLKTTLGWWWLNPAAGLAVVYFILREGLEAIR